MSLSSRGSERSSWPAISGPWRAPDEVQNYLNAGYWSDRTLADFVSDWAVAQPDHLALTGDQLRLTWADYDQVSTDLAVDLVAAGLSPGDRLATLLPDGPEVHVAWLAAEKAGLVSVGVGSRAGPREVEHLLAQTRATAIMTLAGRDGPSVDPGSARQIVMSPMESPRKWKPAGLVARNGAPDLTGRGMGASDVFLLNSTSGTTGLPKCVMHTQNRWAYFHSLAVDAGDLSGEDVFCSALPAPFGFGLWTAHFTPTYLGAPCHTRRRFNADAFLDLMVAERVTVLAAVSTQLIMLLNSPKLDSVDLSSLRVVFTGGEAVPYEKAARFEDVTGAIVLQFYGSNETGAISRTTRRDSRQRRLTTAGRIIDEMHVRLIDPETGRPEPGTRGQPVCRGPATCEGYYNDPDANAQLYTPDGWMLMPDIVEIDSDGYLTVLGRTSDIIIRGGKNISAAAVEAEVMTHPAVALAAAVAVPDTVFGERVGVFVELRAGTGLSLAELSAHLEVRGVTREWFPEHLMIVDRIPRSSGGKVAKSQLREEVKAQAAERRLAESSKREATNRPVDQSNREGKDP